MSRATSLCRGVRPKARASSCHRLAGNISGRGSISSVLETLPSNNILRHPSGPQQTKEVGHSLERHRRADLTRDFQKNLLKWDRVVTGHCGRSEA
jgi:hypothetical protein